MMEGDEEAELVEAMHSGDWTRYERLLREARTVQPRRSQHDQLRQRRPHLRLVKSEPREG